MSLQHKFKIKPLSANRMFGARGKRTFKSADYVAYQNEIRDQMFGVEWPFGDDPLFVYVKGGFSNRGADLDNIIKPILDTYQGIFEDFNDNKVYYIELEKDIVPKGEEYIEVEIERQIR